MPNISGGGSLVADSLLRKGLIERHVLAGRYEAGGGMRWPKFVNHSEIGSHI